MSRRDKSERLLLKPKPTFELKKPVPKPVKIDDKKKPPSNTMKITDDNKYKKGDDKITMSDLVWNKEFNLKKAIEELPKDFTKLLKTKSGQYGRKHTWELNNDITAFDYHGKVYWLKKGTEYNQIKKGNFEVYKVTGGFEVKQKGPKTVKIDDSKKPPSNIISLIPVKSIDATNPLTKKDYEDIRDIPAEDIFKNIEDNKTPVFYPWRSYFSSAIFTYTYILKENNNDCSLPIDLLDKIGKEKNTTNKMITNPNTNLKKYAKEIAESIVRCWKRDKVVCIPISLVQGGKKHTHSYHANMLMFNSYRMEAEHFEPHGRFFHGQGKYVLDNSTGIEKLEI